MSDKHEKRWSLLKVLIVAAVVFVCAMVYWHISNLVRGADALMWLWGSTK